MFLVHVKKKLFNYRNKYLGNYEFEVHRYYFNVADSVSTDTLLFYSGEISYGDKDSTIKIQYLENNSIEPIVNKNGKLSSYGWYFSGEFTNNDDVKFYMHYGGLGGGTSYSVKGTKN